MGKKRKGDSSQLPPAKKAKPTDSSDAFAVFGGDDYVDDNEDDDDDDDDEGGFSDFEDPDYEAVDTGVDLEKDDVDGEYALGLRSVADADENHLVVKEKTKKTKKSKDAPITSAELSELKAADTLFKSNLFKLQIEELLKSVRVNYEKTSALESALHELKEVIDNLRTKKMSTGFKFHKPKTVNVVGSYLLRTVAKPHLNVDVTVEIPEASFQPKDFINGRYRQIKDSYLEYLTKKVQAHPRFSSASYGSFCGDPSKRLLEVKPGPDRSGERPIRTKFVIHVHLTLPRGVFVEAKLGPDRCNIRKVGQAKLSAATPHYNNAILEDMFFVDHLALLHAEMSSPQGGAALSEATLLLKTWRNQRWPADTPDVPSNFFLSMVLVHLVGARTISRHVSSYQAFRLVMEFLDKVDMSTSGVVMATSEDAKPTIDTTLFDAAFDVVFLDNTGTLNLAARMSRGTYKRLQREARLTLGYLADPVRDGFDAIFMTRLAPLYAFDAFISLSLPGADSIAELAGEALHDEGAEVWMWKRTCSILERALGDRASIVSRARLPTGELEGFVVGVHLDPANTTRVIDMGPHAQSDEADDFKGFWKEKAELRRFKDGAISYAVVWEADNNDEIVGMIIRWALENYCAYDASDITLFGVPDAAAESVLDSRKIECALLNYKGTDFTANGDAVRSVFDALQLKIKTLTLPLSVTSIQGVSPVLRGTELCPAPPHPMAGDPNQKKRQNRDAEKSKAQWNLFADPIEAVVSFEGSSSWPDDLGAIGAIKTAFYLKLAEGVSTKLGYEAVPHADSVDVMAEGFVFRFLISYPREKHLMENAKDFERAAAFNLSIIERPLLAARILGFHQSFPTFDSTVRLFKRWLHSHMFSGHVSEEVAELLVAAMFSSPRPFHVAGSPTVGFLRVLHLLTEFSFADTPLIVDLDGRLAVDEWNVVQKSISEPRKRPPAIYVSFPGEGACTPWTVSFPTHAILDRLKAYAGRTLQIVESQLALSLSSSSTPVNWMTAFRTPLRDFDILIHLDPSALPRESTAPITGEKRPKTKAAAWLTAKRFKNLREGSDAEALLVGFDPVEELIHKLTDRFGHVAQFFFNKYGGTVIGVRLWPALKGPRPFKMGGFASMPAWGESNEKKARLTIKTSVVEMVSDIEQLGEGIVSSVVPQTDE